MTPRLPSRGEVWMANLDPARGHEQAGHRPCLIVSVDPFNHGPADLHVVLPLTTREKGILLHVEVAPQEANLKRRSFIKCEDIRSISRERFSRLLGPVSPATLAEVEDRLRRLLGLRS